MRSKQIIDYSNITSKQIIDYVYFSIDDMEDKIKEIKEWIQSHTDEVSDDAPSTKSSQSTSSSGSSSSSAASATDKSKIIIQYYRRYKYGREHEYVMDSECALLIYHLTGNLTIDQNIREVLSKLTQYHIQFVEIIAP